jgi:hypothetical protein
MSGKEISLISALRIVPSQWTPSPRVDELGLGSDAIDAIEVVDFHMTSIRSHNSRSAIGAASAGDLLPPGTVYSSVQIQGYLLCWSFGEQAPEHPVPNSRTFFVEKN